MNIVFFGSSKYIVPILSMLKSTYDLSLVVTTEKNPQDTVPLYCRKNAVPFISIEKFDKKTIEEIKKQNAKVAILAYFGLFLPDEVLDIFPKGIINIHPSLLPKDRGPTPVQTTILNGKTKTGVTIIKLDQEIDHGPILAQTEESAIPSDTTDSLHIRLFEKGSELLKIALERYLNGNQILKEQDHKKATYTEHLTRTSGYIDSNNPPEKKELKRMIHAYFPWPGVWTQIRIKNKQIRIKLLPEGKLQLQDKKPMTYKDFYNGYPELKGKLENLLV